LITLLMLMTTACPALAQRSKKKDDPPKPRPVKLGTKDGMELSGFYFGSNEGKKAIPVLLVHGWEGQKAPYGSLCMALRNAGCAVLALDYRGHGGSREYTDRAGNTKELDPTTMNKRHVANIVRFDLEAAKAFLKKENNEGRLNLNALTVIGVRDGCVLAAGWTQRDWQFPSVGSRKQGQDVKALVMVSPERVLKGIAIDNALVDPSVAGLPTLVVVGEGSREESDARRVIKRLEVLKKKISGSKDPEGLEVLTVRQPLGGPALVTGSPKVIPEIVKFITSHVEISETDNPWIERE
jgi:pimeloyl-ACP methyl ester carboxylesterase